MEELSRYLINMIHNTTGAIYNFRRQNYSFAYKYSSKLTIEGEKYINGAVQVGFTDSVELLLPVWQQLLEKTEASDETALADIYEKQLLPVLYDIQNCIIENMNIGPKVYWDDNMALLKEKDIELYKLLTSASEDNSRSYIFAWASSGDPILKIETDNGIVQLHSEVNPWQEAYDYCMYNSKKRIEESIIVGIGMGYHALNLMNMYPYKKITILENDMEQLRILFMYDDISDLLKNKNISIKYIDDISIYRDILSKTDENKECLIWYPSIKTIKDNYLREFLEDFWINLSSVKNQDYILERNFEKNISAGCKDINVLKDKFKGKTMILAAGGPSLDDEIENLKRISNEKNKSDIFIVSVGKVAKKLVENGITPDYIVMTDPNERTTWQIDGIENCGSALLVLSSTASGVVEKYIGDCYIAFQEGFDLAEKYAAKNKINLFKTGGSVATFAIDMGIRMGCAKVVCVGMDMAYTNNRTHTSGIGREISNTKSLRQVKCVDGGIVYTSKTLDMYRSWIEKRIASEKDTEFINTSKGAKIAGMKEKSLIETV